MYTANNSNHPPYALEHDSERPLAQLPYQLHHHVISRLCLDTQQGALELLTRVKWLCFGFDLLLSGV
jgi:hypothetical protein